MDNLAHSDKDEKIELNVLINRYTIFWKQIALCLAFFLLIGFLNIRYSTKVFKSSTTILIKEDSNTSLGSENLFDGIDLFGGKKNIKNEIGILNSFSLIKKTLKSLNFRLSYFHSGNFKSEEIYTKSPFTVELNTAKPTLIAEPYYITIISENEYLLSFECKNAQLFDFNSENYFSNKEYDFKFSKTYQFGELVKTDFFEFVINKNDLSLFLNEQWNSYYFKIHNYDNLTEKYQKNLKVMEIDKDASILKISLEESNPNKINDFLNQFNTLYLELGLEEKNQITSNTIFFINNQLTYISDSLSIVENELENFKQLNPKIQLSQEDYGTFFRVEKLEEEKAILELNNTYYLSLQKYLKDNNDIENIVAPSTIGINDPLLNNLITELSKLYSELQIASINSRDEHPIIRSLQKQIKSTKEKLNENIENIISSSNLSLLDINKRIASIEYEINNLPSKERVLINIQRKFNLNENIYNYLLEKRAEASITKASNVSDHKVIDQPRLESKEPIKPNRLLVLAICFILGLAIPIIVISLYFLFNDKIIDKKDIDQITSKPVIGKIMLNEDGNNLININNPKSGVAEAFRSIRTNIQYLASDKKEKVICLTSSISGEGKTFISMNLASIISITGEKTLLIGADMRKPKIFDDFNLTNDKGLSSYLSNQNTKEEIINKTKYSNLDLILSGPIPPNPSELLNQPKMSEFIKELKKEYKYIIIDTPPIGLVTDGLIIMEHADISMYVVRQNYTTKEMLKHFDDTIHHHKLKSISLIINGITSDRSSYGYGYGYGNTYGYGYYSEDQKLTSKKWWKIS